MLPSYRIDPITDVRWTRLLERHRDASIFHTPGWLKTLKLTYGYEPVAFTTSAPGLDLRDGIVLVQVRSWLTGPRLVSLPFSDHCQPLTDSFESLQSLHSALQAEADARRWKYVEIRPRALQYQDQEELRLTSEQFYFHSLDLRSDAASLFKQFHKSCVQRKIRKAEKENLLYESGRSPNLMKKFYNLLVRTRRRHQLPPQPIAWFHNLIECLGEQVTIRLVSKDEQPVASIMTLAFKKSLVYKYGCSDERFHNLGGMPLLFWTAIQEAKECAFEEMDFGRSEIDNEGLVQFKGHLGATCSTLAYYRYPSKSPSSRLRRWGGRAARQIFSRVPDSVVIPVGKLLYRHLG